MVFRSMNSASSTQQAASITGLLSTVTSGSEAGQLAFYTRTGGASLQERIRIDALGNVGINATTTNIIPYSRLQVVGASTNGGQVFEAVSNASSTLLTILNSGNVGIGTTSPGGILSVQGAAILSTGTSTIYKLNVGDFQATSSVVLANLPSETANQNTLCINSTNKFVMENSGTSCVVSSRRFKYDIYNQDSAIPSIMSLHPRVFKYKGQTDEHLGLIAEEVEEVDKRFVSYDKEGLPHTVRYEEMVSLLAKGIQELNQKVDAMASSTTLDSGVSGSSISDPSKVWSVDQQTGKVKAAFSSGLDLAGNEIINASRILSENGKWSIDTDGTLIASRVITDEIVTQKLSASESLKVGTPEKPIGITIYDEDTGTPYCVKVKNAAMVSVAGECGMSSGQEVSLPEGSETSSESGGLTSEGSETSSLSMPVPESTTPVPSSEPVSETPSAPPSETVPEPTTEQSENTPPPLVPSPEAAPPAPEPDITTTSEAPLAPAS